MQIFGKLIPSTWPEGGTSTPQRLSSTSPPRIQATRLEAILNPERPQVALANSRISHKDVSHLRHGEWREHDMEIPMDTIPINSLSPIPCNEGIFDDKMINSQNICIINAKLREFLEDDGFSCRAPPGCKVDESVGEDMGEMEINQLSYHPTCPLDDFQSIIYSNVPPTHRVTFSARLSNERTGRKKGPGLERERLRSAPILDSPFPAPSSADDISISPTLTRPGSGLVLTQFPASPLSDDRSLHYKTHLTHSAPPRGHSTIASMVNGASSSSESGTSAMGVSSASSTIALPLHHSGSSHTNVIVCEFDNCGMRIDVQDTPLGVHLNNSHRPRNQDRNSNVTCLWDDCGQSVKWRNLRRHIMEYHLALLFKECPVCEKTFSRSDALKRHERLYCPGRRKAAGRGGLKQKPKLPYKPLTWRTSVDWSKPGSRKSPGSAEGVMMEEEEEDDEYEGGVSVSE